MYMVVESYSRISNREMKLVEKYHLEFMTNRKIERINRMSEKRLKRRYKNQRAVIKELSYYDSVQLEVKYDRNSKYSR